MNAPLLSRSMSSPSTPSQLDPDELFTRLTIPEIKQIQQQLRNDADAKQEELRLMVGERYRDLLQASSSIISISESAKRVTQALENAQDTIKSQELLPLPKKTSASDAMDAQLQMFQLLSAHIKLLLDAPEHLWRLLERKRYLPAAWFFLLSRVVQRALLRGDEDEESWSNHGIDVQEEFPIVQRQWEIVSQFRSQIMHKATISLQDYTSSVEDTCATLLALHLLDTRPLADALATLISQRSKALQALLSSLSKSGQPNGTAAPDLTTPTLRQLKQLLQTCFALVAETITSARRIFLDEGEQVSLLRAVMQDVQSDAPDTISSTLPPSLKLSTQSVLETFPSAPHLFHLPPSLKQYKPYIDTTSPTTFVHSAHLVSVLEKWLSSSIDLIKTAASEWFTKLGSAKDVWNIRSSIREWLLNLNGLTASEMDQLNKTLDILSRTRVIDVWKSALAKAEAEMQTTIPTSLAASSSQSKAKFEKSPVANLFHPPPLPTLAPKTIVSNDTPFSKYQSAICDRLVGRTALLDAVLRILENCAKSLQNDIAFISAASKPESTNNVQTLKETFRPEAEALCLSLLTVVSTSASNVRRDNADGLIFLVQLTSILASSSDFPTNTIFPETLVNDFRQKMSHIHEELVERWRKTVLNSIFPLLPSSSANYKLTLASPKGPSSSLVEALMKLANAITTVNLSYRETANMITLVRLFIETFLSQKPERPERLIQFVWDVEFLVRMLETQGDTFGDLTKDLRASSSKLCETVQNYPAREELERGCADYLARTQTLLTPLMPKANTNSYSWLRHGIPSSEAPSAMNVATPSARFALVLVGDNR